MMTPHCRRPSSTALAAARRLCGVAASALALVAYQPDAALAIPVNPPQPEPKYFAYIAECTNPLLRATYGGCMTPSYLNLTSLKFGDEDFKASFDAWNRGNAEAAKWTLANGGKLPGGELDVTLFRTFAER